MTDAHPLPQRAPPPHTNTPADLPVLVFITNGSSTQNKAARDWYAAVLANEPHAHVLHAHGPVEMSAAVKQAAALKAEIIAINGGDGTVDMVFSALLNDKPFQQPPLIALLPAGKTNMTAAAWCGAPDKHAALRNLLAARRARTLSATPHPILTLDQGSGAAPLRGAFLGAADVVDGILFCRKHIYPLKLPNTISHSMAVLVLLWRSLFTRSDAAVIDATWGEDRKHGAENGKFFFLGVMTLNKLILDLEPQPASGTGGLFYLSLKSGLGAILSAIPRLVTKRVRPGTKRNVRRAEKITLAFDGAYTLDGELYDAKKATPLVITADETLRFIDLRGV
ncbi:MAG: hypothetical protein JNM81_12350 [Rhodospirillaceae bacterium]|nr:hypothetical protein [Rhodospirillaceae bacterium]